MHLCRHETDAVALALVDMFVFDWLLQIYPHFIYWSDDINANPFHSHYLMHIKLTQIIMITYFQKQLFSLSTLEGQVLIALI